MSQASYTIDIYCLGSNYRGRMYEFQITNVPYLAPNHVHTPGNTLEYDANCHYYTCISGDGTRINEEPHTFGEYTVVSDPTCTEYGSQVRVCTVCGYEEYSSIYPHGHNYEQYYVTKEPTCTEPGYEEAVCTICNHVEQWELSPYGHSWDEGVIVKNPTHTEAGEKVYTCMVCGETKSQSIAPDHNWGSSSVYQGYNDYVGYTKSYCLEDSAVKIDIKAIDGTILNGGYAVQGENYMRLNSNGASISYKFNYDDHAIGKVYLRGAINSYSSNQNRTYSSSVNAISKNGCCFDISVNNVSVDMSETMNIPYSEMLNDGYVDPSLSTSYSPVANCLVGMVELNYGDNEIVYTRTGSYNLYVSDLILVVEHTDHNHSYTGAYEYDTNYHWHTCSDPDCPMKGTQINKVEHNFVEVEQTGSHSCNEQGAYLYQCTECGYQKTMGATSEHSFDYSSTVYGVNSYGYEVTFRYCPICGRTVASMPFSNGIVLNGSYDSNGKLKQGTTMMWRIPVYNAGAISIYLPCKMSSGNTGQTFDPSLYNLTINGTSVPILLAYGTYDELGIGSNETRYYKFGEYVVTHDDVINGEIEITFTSNNANYRMIFDGEIRIDY